MDRAAGTDALLTPAIGPESVATAIAPAQTITVDFRGRTLSRWRERLAPLRRSRCVGTFRRQFTLATMVHSGSIPANPRVMASSVSCVQMLV
ncbi:MAG TPA: hypothetical protein DCQ04_15655 [Actinobacteria bacterium]|nr:hypothetical protein [Actinomycetota bacterium]